MSKKVITKERGWPGHFCLGYRCVFHRNTLVECGNIKIVVSTVGNYMDHNESLQEIGLNRYYETMAFHSDPSDEKYHDVDVTKEVSFTSGWRITEKYKDNEANAMHENVVIEIVNRLLHDEIGNE